MSYAGYLRAVVLQNRLFLGSSLLFLGTAATLTFLVRQQRGQAPAT